MSEALCTTPWALLNYFFLPQNLSLTCEAVLSGSATFAPLSWFAYARIFWMTVLLESSIYGLGFWLLAPKLKRTWWQFLGLVVLLNLATHPAVSFGFSHLAQTQAWSEAKYLAVAESFAIVVEAILLWRPYGFPIIAAFTLPLAANLFSWMVGSFIVR